MASSNASNVGSKVSNVVSDFKNDLKNKSPREEGELTQRIESQTAKVPSIGYLGLAVGSMVLSAGLAFFSKKKEYANFVGLWAPSFMLVGIYNKLVKLEGSDSKTSDRKVA